jgi:biotin carboxyl carrier protein
MLKVSINQKSFEVSEDKTGMFVDDKPFKADILEYRQGKFHILHDNHSYAAEVIAFDKDSKTLRVRVNNSTMEVTVKDEYDVLLTQMGIDQSAGAKVNDIKAPMPGMVLNVMVANGQEIKKGDAIVVLEAMKMENILKSPADGVVKRILVNKGDKVEKNQIMVNLD